MKINSLTSKKIYCQKFIVFIYSMLFCIFTVKSNNNLDFNFEGALFSLAKVHNTKDVLFQFKPQLSKWVKIGDTGTKNIYSIAIDSDNLIYAVNGGVLGTLNPVTGKFSEIGSIGGGTGVYGYTEINNIYGLTFDPIEKVLYATNRVNGSEDILIKINPLNGKLIQKDFTNFLLQKVDYIAIEASIVKATINPSAPLTEVTSLLYEPITQQLICIQHKFNEIAMSLVHKKTGFLVEVIFDFSSTGIISVDYDNSGNIYATTLNDIDSENGITQIDLGIGSINMLNPMNIINEPNLQFIGLAITKTAEKIQNCQNEINLICTSPQLPEVKAKKAIYSNADLLVDTSYKSEGEISLHNYFNAPANINFSIEIENTCN